MTTPAAAAAGERAPRRQSAIRRFIVGRSPALRIILFILLALVLWVVLSAAINLAYESLPRSDAAPTVAEQADPGGTRAAERGGEAGADPAGREGGTPEAPWYRRLWDWLTRWNDGDRGRAWYFLVLPVAMLIAGLVVWPNEEDTPHDEAPRLVGADDVIAGPEHFVGQHVVVAARVVATADADPAAAFVIGGARGRLLVVMEEGLAGFQPPRSEDVYAVAGLVHAVTSFTRTRWSRDPRLRGIDVSSVRHYLRARAASLVVPAADSRAAV